MKKNSNFNKLTFSAKQLVFLSKLKRKKLKFWYFRFFQLLWKKYTKFTKEWTRKNRKKFEIFNLDNVLLLNRFSYMALRTIRSQHLFSNTRGGSASSNLNWKIKQRHWLAKDRIEELLLTTFTRINSPTKKTERAFWHRFEQGKLRFYQYFTEYDKKTLTYFFLSNAFLKKKAAAQRRRTTRQQARFLYNNRFFF